MSTYLLRRVLIGALTLLFITFLVYGLIRSMPGDPLLFQLEQSDPGRKMRAEDIEAMREAFGLNKPWPLAYVEWLGKLMTFDLGSSLSRHIPVDRIIGQRIGPTLLLSVTSLILAYLISIPVGLFSTVRSGKFDERLTSTLLYMLYSLPVFVAALFLQIVFFQKLGWFPLDGMRSDEHDSLSAWGKTLDIAWHALLPIVCETYVLLAYYSRFIRSNMQEVIRQDYIRTARAKGVAPGRVIVRHAFRNTLIPLVTMIGLTLPSLLSGAVILEQIFSWPGMGAIFFESIRERDYPTIMGLVLMFSFLTLLGQLLADVLYAVVDPRVTYS
jgi:peptide/nickel transport system permease protein